MGGPVKDFMGHNRSQSMHCLISEKPSRGKDCQRRGHRLSPFGDGAVKSMYPSWHTYGIWLHPLLRARFLPWLQYKAKVTADQC